LLIKNIEARIVIKTYIYILQLVISQKDLKMLSSGKRCSLDNKIIIN